MLRRARLRSLTEQAGMTQETARFIMDIPIVATEVMAGVWEVAVNVYITPCTELNILNDKTYSIPSGAAFDTRTAKEAEVAVLLWKSPGIAGLYVEKIYSNVVGPEFGDGQWNVVPDQASLTSAGGQVILGRPGWKGSSADRASSTMTLEDGWYRITAQHLQSGYIIARRFLIESQWLDSAATSPMIVQTEGTPQSATFSQARLKQASLHQPASFQPSYKPFGSMAPYL